MSKVGIITFTDGDNYGQRLQNLAVQEIIKELGFEPYTIRQNKGLRKRLKIAKQGLKSFLSGTWMANCKRHIAFKRFDRTFINYYYKSISEKNMNIFPEQNFSFFVAGSDQIWSPYSDDVNATMFLWFTNKYKRISIVPSMACEEIPYELRDIYKEYLTAFKWLSVRENKGAQLIYELVGRKPEVLIDPTLMFNRDFWEKYENKPIWLKESDYLLFYFLGSRELCDSVDELKIKYCCPVIDLLEDKRYRVSGPSEFLYLIHHSKLVVTDSYHGSIFSMLYGVPFMFKERQESSLNMSSRFDTLIEKFHLTVSEDGTINTNEFGKLIPSEKDKEIDYLKRAFGIA